MTLAIAIAGSVAGGLISLRASAQEDDMELLAPDETSVQRNCVYTAANASGGTVECKGEGNSCRKVTDCIRLR